MRFRHSSRQHGVLAFILLALAVLAAGSVNAEGEAGILTLRGQGHFFVGVDTSSPAENGAVSVKNQMYVGFQLPAEKKHPYPLLLIHSGGGQSAYWFSTPDGRDGWRDYFLADGFDVYWADLPGFGRSPTSLSYGELRESGTTQIISFLANSRHWPGDPKNHTDPTILSMLAGSPPGPSVGSDIAARDLSELLDEIGPAILLTHSAGALAGWWAADLNPDKVAGIIAIEPGPSNVTSRIRHGLTFNPPLAEDFKPVKDDDDCDLQGSDQPSRLKHFAKIPVRIVGSEMGLVAGLPCAIKTFQEAGVKAEYTYLPDLGFFGNGHFMMVEKNNGELAQIIIKLARDFE